MKNRVSRRAVAGALLGAALSAGALPANAQTPYPSRPVKFVVLTPAGTTVDALARVLGSKLSIIWNQQVVVDPRPGAAGNIGAEFVAKSPADGYTFMLAVNNTMTVNPHIYSRPGFDPLVDFAPVTGLGFGGYWLVVNTAVPVKTFPEFLRYAREQGDKLSYASYGAGSGSHLSGEMLNAAGGLRMIHVPYKSSPVTDVIGGVIPVSIEPPVVASPHVESGRLRVLATTAVRRSSAYPDVPSMAEFLPGYESHAWIALFAPKGVPASIVNSVSADVQKILNTPEMTKQFLMMGMEPMLLGPEQMRQRVRQDYEVYKKLVTANHIKVD